MNHAKGSMNRRDLFTTAMTAGAASILASQSAKSDEQAGSADSARSKEPSPDDPAPRLPIIDTNVSLFQWPFRRLPLDDLNTLVEKLRTLGIVEAWAGSFEGILHRDLTGVNRRLAEACARYPELIPIGSISPELPDWEDDLRRCIEEHNMPGIRLHPNYHGYALDDPRFARLLERATAAGCFVQIAAAMEDIRTQHPMVQVAEVELGPLHDLMQKVDGARVQILNARLRSPLLERLAAIPGMTFDTSRVEGTDGIAQLLRTVSADQVVFGSHAPFLIPEAALIRIHESDLGEGTRRLLLAENAQQAAERHDG